MSAAKEAARAVGAGRYKPYPAYKHSGVEWLGEIPAHWDVERLKHAASLHGSVSANASDCDGTEGDVCYVSPEELIDCYARSATSRWLAPTTAKRYDIVPAESTAICTIASVGQSCQFVRPFVTNPQVKGLSARAHVEGRFLALMLLAAKAEVRRLSTVSVVPFINGTSLLELRVPRLPTREQRAIAAFLDRETARIDALVAKKERLIALLQEQRTALITRAVTKGLDPTVPMKDSGVEWLGETPAHWEVRRLRHVVESVKNGTTVNQLEYGETEYRVTRIETISNGVIDLSKTGFVEYSPELDDYRLEKGDLLLSHINSISMLGNCALYDLDVPLYGGMNLLRLRPNNDAINGRWLWNWLRSVFGRESVRSRCKPAINQASVPIGALKSIATCVPPLPEQRAIAAFLDRETARIDALVDKVREAIERLKELRTALISAAVTGKIDVRGEAA